MLDEPMAGVNPALKQSLNEHIRGLRDDGMTVLFVEHDMDMVHDISDWVIVMAEGQVIAEGTPDDISSNPAVIDAYLGAHQGKIAPVEGSMAILEGNELVAGYIPEVNILNGCDLVVNDGEFVGIIGPNGAGKSTFLKAALGLCSVRSGAGAARGQGHHRA